MNRILLVLLLSTCALAGFAQLNHSFADSIRVAYHIPELGFAVLTADSVLEIEVLGERQFNTSRKANINDRFRIGSNTKTITSYIAAVLVKQGKLTWDTKFFDVYPELKAQSHEAFYDMSLQDLLTFRVRLMKWSYGNEEPTTKQIMGSPKQQRYQFVSWILRQQPVDAEGIVFWSNPAYVAAGMMLEKVAGKDYETLVMELGSQLGIQFGFGPPNLLDSKQPWGHDENLVPEKPLINHKLDWLSSAGNINLSLPDYAVFMQLHLQGLAGRSKVFTLQEFQQMHYGLPEFAFGWKWYVDIKNRFIYSYHEGNPGTFLTTAVVCHNTGKAFILVANVQSEEAEQGFKILLEELKSQYSSG